MRYIKPIFCVLISLIVAKTSDAELWCYQCFSAMSGCGESMDVRMQHWVKCDSSRVYQNYCVKYIEKIGGQTYITRGCLNTFLRNTNHRMDIPKVQRHGYCVNSISYQQAINKKGISALGGEFKRYCFCNDWNGCNSAKAFEANRHVISALALAGIALLKLVY